MAVYVSKKSEETKAKAGVYPDTPVSDEAMEKLARIMNDSPSYVKLEGTEWEIRGLKPAVQWLICEEACKVVKEEKATMGDVLKEFSTNLPSVARVLTLALLNDKDRIFKDYDRREYSDEYKTVFDVLMWGNYTVRDWVVLLGEILQHVDVDFFFESTNVIKTVRETTLMRKTTKAEVGL